MATPYTAQSLRGYRSQISNILMGTADFLHVFDGWHWPLVLILPR